MHQDSIQNQLFRLNSDKFVDLRIKVPKNKNSLRKMHNQQFNHEFNSTETNFNNHLNSQNKPTEKQMSKPFPAYQKGQFSPVQKKFEKTSINRLSPKSRSPQSPKPVKSPNPPKNNNHLQSKHPKIMIPERVQLLSLEIHSAKNSAEKQGKTSPKKTFLAQEKEVPQLDASQLQFSLPLNEKLVTLQKKSNRLIEKVLAIQQQIQKYAEVQQKQLRPIGLQGPSSPLLQTKSLLNKRGENEEVDPAQAQHLQNLKKMNILGKNKVKMIETLEMHIQNLQNKVMSPSNKKKQDIDDEKKEIDNKFANYYRHKNDILKQSKSQKFSFKHLKYLTKQNKFDKSECGEQIIETMEGKQGQENLQTQLRKLKEQFSSYQQRTSKQLQNYKERLNQNILQKQIMKKQLEREKYENLKEKIFNKNRVVKSSKLISPQKTSREYVEPRFILDVKLEEKQQSQIGVNIADLMNFPKTDRPTNADEQTQQFQDLQHFKDEVSMRYVEQNEQIQGLHEKIRDMEEIIEDLRNKLQKSHSHFMTQTEELNRLLDEKQKVLDELTQINELNVQQIDDLKNEINDMNNYIFQCKQENESQSQEIEQYKIVVEEFMEQVSVLRQELGQKNVLNDQMHCHIEEAQKINKMCQKEINKLEKENQKMKEEMEKLQNQVKLKQAKQRYSDALLQKQKQQLEKFTTNIKETNDNSLISQYQLSKTSSKLIQSATEESKAIKQLRQQNQQKLDLQRIEFDKYLKQKDNKIQQLEENLQVIKSDIGHKVDQQVNQGIRTFLRYRKHSNHLAHETFKLLVHGKKIYNLNKFQNIQFDLLNFKEIKIQESSRNISQSQLVTCSTDRSSTGGSLSLRKLIDTKFNIKVNSIKQDQLPFKLHISLKLIEFAIDVIKQEGSSHEVSTKSLKASNKNLPSLHPESIYVVESQIQTLSDQQSNQPSDLTLRQRVQRLQKNFKSYQFIHLLSTKKESETKKDRNLVYLSPQVLLSMNESQHSYCWTLGIIIDQIFNSRPFYTKIDQIVTRKDNYKFVGSSNYAEHIGGGIKSVLEKMVKKNFKERPTLQNVYEKLSQIAQQN